VLLVVLAVPLVVSVVVMSMKNKSLFVETFGDTPLVRVTEFFLTFREFDYSKSQVAAEADVSRVTIENVWKQLIRNGIIVKTRKVGNGELYKVNLANPKVKILMKTVVDLSLSYLNNIKEHKIPLPA